jgi:hypothetical protein
MRHTDYKTVLWSMGIDYSIFTGCYACENHDGVYCKIYDYPAGSSMRCNEFRHFILNRFEKLLSDPPVTPFRPFGVSLGDEQQNLYPPLYVS